MKYLLHLENPKGKEVYELNKNKVKRVREYFKRIEILETEIFIKDKKYKAYVDFKILTKKSNFDCFNCQDTCCGGNPTKYHEKTREFILENRKRYNELTKNEDIQLSLGIREDELESYIMEKDFMVHEDFVENEIMQCTCCFKPNNKTTLCSIHAIALEKSLDFKEISEIKPLICILWPLELIYDSEEKICYITLPDDFTNDFTRENYYKIGCINYEYAQSCEFRRFNPEGFLEDEYEPFYLKYKKSLIYGLGKKFYKDVVEKIKKLEED